MVDYSTAFFQVNREYNLQCYLHSSPVLGETIEYTFEPYGQDKVTGMSRDHGAEIFLDKDARKWATKLVKDQRAIANIEKQVKGLKSVTSAYIRVSAWFLPCTLHVQLLLTPVVTSCVTKKLIGYTVCFSVQTPEFGTSESFTEAQQNIENLKEDIRQLEVHVTKAEARLEALRGVGVDVAKWLQKAGDSQEKSSELSSVSSLGELVVVLVGVGA